MSTKKAAVKIDPLPPCPAPYCDTYRFQVDDNGVATLWGARGTHWQTGMAISVGLAADLVNKLGASIDNMVQRRAMDIDEERSEGESES